MLENFRNNVNKLGNKNFKFVYIRQDRKCKCCGKSIQSGVECLTVNKKTEPRCWYCCDCVRKLLNIHNAKVTLDSVSFDDEGMVLACMDYLDECVSELYKE